MYKPDHYNNKVPILEYPIKLDIGAGKFPREGYQTLDFAPGSDIQWDLKDGIPLPDNSVERLVASHVLEHFEPTELHYILMEILRVCQNEAEVIISIPHGETDEAHLPCHYQKITEANMRAWANWRQEPESRLELIDIKRDGYNLIGIFKVIKQ